MGTANSADLGVFGLISWGFVTSWDALGSTKPTVGENVKGWPNIGARWHVLAHNGAKLWYTTQTGYRMTTMPRPPKTLTTVLIRRHSCFDSVSDLGRAIGEPNLTRKIGRIRTDRILLKPSLMDKIASHLNPVGRRLLVVTMARDAQLPGYLLEEANLYRDLAAELRSLSENDLEQVILLIRRLKADGPDKSLDSSRPSV